MKDSKVIKNKVETPKIEMRVQRFRDCVITQFIENKKIIETIIEYK
jgi:hypothetical protein